MKKRCLTMLFMMLLVIGMLTVPAFAADEASGKCGDDIIWSYYAEKQLLSIFGSGRMYDYGEGLAPWAQWADEISEVQISSGIYTIGHNVFSGCDNLYYVSYLGTLEQWMDISIESGNDQLGLCCIECTDFKPDANTHFGAFADELGSVFWLLDSQGNLTVYGTGTMELDTSCGPADDVKAPWADWRDDILTVTVREGITATTYKLFADCVNLKSAYLPESLGYLGTSTFYGCSSLAEVELPTNRGSFTMGSGAFFNCTSLKTIELPSCIEKIDDITFQGCSSLEEIVIPEGVDYIGSFAFYNCSSLKTVYLPACLERIIMSININHYGKSPFAGCTSLVNIVVPEGSNFAVDERGVLFHKEKGWLIFAPANLSGSYTIPDTVSYVWAGAFENCVNLTEIIIPDSVDTIYNQVFHNCTSLKEITIPNSVTEFGYEVFLDCTALERVTLSNQLEILDGTFRGCTALKSVDIPDSVTELGFKTFSGCTALTEVKMSDNITAIGDYSFENCSALTDIHIPETVTIIGESAFAGCSTLESVDYGCYKSQWENIEIKHGNESLLAAKTKFKSCKGHEVVVTEAAEPTCDQEGNTEGRSCKICGEVLLEMTKIPMLGHQVENRLCSVCGETLDWYFTPATGTLTICFDGPMDDYDGELDGPWWDLREQVIHVVVQEGVTTIGNSAFPQFKNLKTVTLPQGITSIGRLAFQLCEELESINIPDTVTSIGEAALNGTLKLAEIYIPKSVESIGPGAVEGGLYREAFVVDPENPYYSSDLAGNLYNKEKTKLIMAPNYMKAVFIPASVTEIGDGVFALSEHMDAIYFCGTEEQWLAMKIGNRNYHMPETVYVGVSAERDCAKGNHIVVGKDGREPTCTEEGITDRKICIVCTEVTEEQKVMAKLPHTYENGVCTMCGAAEPEKPVESPFTDVQTTDWFFAPVLWAKESGVTGGKTETTFAPNESCTRAQVVTFLWAANGKPAPKTTDNPFTDVPNDAWYLQPVLWAVENGITGGTSPTTFGPDNYCTRAQVVTFLYAAAGKPDVSGKSTFEDVADTDWFAKPVIWAKENNVTGGISPTRFGPNNVCTRAQVVTFLYSSKDNMPDTPDVPEKPIGDHEAYGAVCHALWQPAANTPLNQLPRYDETATYEGIQRILDTCDPDGALMFRYDPEGAFGWISPEQGMTEATDTAIHETYHGFSYDFGRDATTYYLGNGYYLVVPETKIYLSEEMTVLIPAENRTFRFNTYVGEGSDLSSNLRGIYGLLDEFNAYQMGMNYATDMFDYYCAQKSSLDSWSEYINSCENNRQAYAEFRYYILTYLLYAKEHYPAIYEGLMENEKLRYAFTIVEANFAEDIAQYEADLNRLAKGEIPGTGKIRVDDQYVWFGNRGTGRFTAEYKKLMAAMSTPAYTEMMETFTLK